MMLIIARCRSPHVKGRVRVTVRTRTPTPARRTTRPRRPRQRAAPPGHRRRRRRPVGRRRCPTRAGMPTCRRPRLDHRAYAIYYSGRCRTPAYRCRRTATRPDHDDEPSPDPAGVTAQRHGQVPLPDGIGAVTRRGAFVVPDVFVARSQQPPRPGGRPRRAAARGHGQKALDVHGLEEVVLVVRDVVPAPDVPTTRPSAAGGPPCQVRQPSAQHRTVRRS